MGTPGLDLDDIGPIRLSQRPGMRAGRERDVDPAKELERVQLPIDVDRDGRMRRRAAGTAGVDKAENPHRRPRRLRGRRMIATTLREEKRSGEQGDRGQFQAHPYKLRLAVPAAG